ncbi:MAG TPA: cupin domain-containing protein [Burkholderiaceae bacterium]
MTASIVRFDLPATPPEIDHPREERREIGAPERRTWVLYESGPAGMVAGIWECEVGRWRIRMDPAEHEYMVVLAGRVRLHDAGGGFTEAGPGEALVIPPGFAGSFEVLERVRKHFVIVVGPQG